MKLRLIRSAAPIALVALTVLTACNSKPATETMNVGTGDPQADELANAAPAAPPPMIKSSHSYRCKDNSLVFVDFMTDDKSANFRTKEEGPVTALTAPEAGKPYVSADGKTTVTGAGTAITLNGVSCKAG